MNRSIDKRELLLSGCAAATTIVAANATLGQNAAKAQGLFGRGTSAFETILRNSKGAVAANFSDFAVQSPEGTTCTARLAFPLVLNKKLPVLMFCPDDRTSATQYDQITGALAAQDFFVVTIDRRLTGAQASRPFLNSEQQAEQRLRRFAEARFLLDTIDAAAAALGANAQLVDASRIGAMGHGEGAWIAAGLGGWDSNGAPSTRTRDGRIYSVVGLLPARSASPSNVRAQESPDGVHGMFIGNLGLMPTPARGSGLLGLGLPIQSPTFGGLIGNPTPAEARRMVPERDALATAVSSSTLFFDWTLRGNNSRRNELLELDGVRVPGLAVPLQLRKA